MQRERLFRAAATVFARLGYAEGGAETISREAGMSKATFYEHFANKEECILALFDHSAGLVLRRMAEAARAQGENPVARLLAGGRAFLATLAAHPDEAQTLLVEIIGAGPRAAQRRDEILRSFAEGILSENAAGAARTDDVPRFASPHDAFAIVGAMAELVSRQVRLGEPADIRELGPVLERLMLGLLEQADSSAR